MMGIVQTKHSKKKKKKKKGLHGEEATQQLLCAKETRFILMRLG